MSGWPFQGATGHDYDYILIDMTTAGNVPGGAGNYVIAKGTPGPPIPICIGEADSLYGAVIGRGEWNAAKASHGADRFYCHLMHDPARRQDERLI